jgi:hypothetical protein
MHEVPSRIPSLERGYDEHALYLCVWEVTVGGFEPHQQPPCNLGYTVRVYRHVSHSPFLRLALEKPLILPLIPPP